MFKGALAHALAISGKTKEAKVILNELLELSRKKLRKENSRLQSEAEGGFSFENIIGKSVQMKKVLSLISKVSQNDIPVLITGQVYSEFITEEEWLSGKQAGVNVVGGDLLKYWSKCIIELQNNRGKKRAIIKKHRSIQQKELNFEIVNEGIRKRGWL